MLETNVSSKLLIHLSFILDVLFAWFLVTPLVVTFWCTTWKLYDQYILPEHPVISGNISLAFGLCGQMLLMFFQDSFKKHLKFDRGIFFNVILPKIHALLMGHTFVSCWRGVWSFVDATSSNELGAVVMNIVQNSIILMISRVFRNSLVPPYFVFTDRGIGSGYCMITLLRKSKENGGFAFFIDCIYTLILEMLIAFIWHDVWYILDSRLIPDNLFCSALSSLVIGYALALICFAMQGSVGFVYEKSDNYQLCIYEAFTTICLFSAVNCWRGIWSLITFYIGNHIKLHFLLNTVAWLLLMIVNCTYSLSAKDLLKDADKSGRDCIEFQIQYFQKLLERNPKLEKQ